MSKKLTKVDLFIQYANPNNKGVSKWKNVKKNVPNEFEDLISNNGYSWCRKNSSLNKTYLVEKKYQNKEGHSPLLQVRLNGYRNKQ